MSKNLKQIADAMSRELFSPVNAYLLAATLAKAERERMDKVDADILDFMDVRDDKGERITDPRRSYRMTDEYWAAYYAERDKRIREMGYKVPKDHCPALIAEELQRKAEHLILETAAKHMPELDPNRLLCCGMEKYREAIRLLVGLAVNHPKYQPVKMPTAA